MIRTLRKINEDYLVADYVELASIIIYGIWVKPLERFLNFVRKEDLIFSEFYSVHSFHVLTETQSYTTLHKFMY